MSTSAEHASDAPTTTGEPELKRVLGPKLLLLFIVGDILGAGVYAVTGTMAGTVGGLVWLPFLLAFIVATMTAFSYLELVTKYPQAAGAALYTHKAFGIHFVTFLVAFAVMCSGITSASTASNAFAGFLRDGIGADWVAGSTPLLLIALGCGALVFVQPTELVTDITWGELFLPFAGDGRWLTPVGAVAVVAFLLFLVRSATASRPR